LAQDDPVYLFTDHRFEDNVSRIISDSLSPLFSYLEALCGNPWVSGKRGARYLFQNRSIFNRPLIDGMVDASNFKYEWTNGRSELRNSQSRLAALFDFCADLGIPKRPGNIGYISFCSLTVKVPDEESNEFWHQERYFWDPSDGEPHCTLTVETLGGTPTEACWRATMSAIERIQCIRENRNPKRPSTPAPAPSDCPALQLARDLHHIFKNPSDMFTGPRDDVKHEKFWNDVHRDLSTRIERLGNSKLRHLLEYYQV
jgi:hypothetical protein